MRTKSWNSERKHILGTHDNVLWKCNLKFGFILYSCKIHIYCPSRYLFPLDVTFIISFIRRTNLTGASTWRQGNYSRVVEFWSCPYRHYKPRVKFYNLLMSCDDVLFLVVCRYGRWRPFRVPVSVFTRHPRTPSKGSRSSNRLISIRHNEIRTLCHNFYFDKLCNFIIYFEYPKKGFNLS